MSDEDLTGVQERVWCGKVFPPAPSLPPTKPKEMTDVRVDPRPAMICQSREECDAQRKEQGVEVFRTVSGPTVTKGCFKKKSVVYWGKGGAADDISKTNLPGVQERVHCGGDKGTKTSSLNTISLAKASTEETGGMTNSSSQHKLGVLAIVAVASLVITSLW